MATSQKNNSLSNLQWFFLFMLALAVDVVQIILNLAYGSGAIANRPISVGFGFALLLVFHLKDVPLSPAQYTSIAGRSSERKYP